MGVNKKRYGFPLIAAAAVLLVLLFGKTEAYAEQKQRGDLLEIPEYSGKASVEINDNTPFFTEEDMAFLPEQYYGELDELGRCTGAYALLSEDLMPTETRGSITEIEPSGWQSISAKDGGNLYQRSHLIAYQLTGSNSERNLITGTAYFNSETMKRYEESVAQYVSGTGHHVMYRVTPVFEGENLVASGVLMEAESVEDDKISFCVFCYNVQPGMEIDYLTGLVPGAAEVLELVPDKVTEDTDATRSGPDYVANKNTKKFHYPYCSSAEDIKEKNRWDFYGTREELIEKGYDPCKRCNP